MDNDIQALDPAVIEPVSTETVSPLTATPKDPITGTEANSSNPANNSNGNQILVNSPIYSVRDSHNSYQYTSITNQQTFVSAGTALVKPGGRGKPQKYRFDSDEYFQRIGNKLVRVDHITDFNSARGDTLELARDVFKGIGELSFVAVEGTKERKIAARSDFDLIYETSSGKLFFNSNHSDPGMGRQGGLFAIMDAATTISPNNFAII